MDVKSIFIPVTKCKQSTRNEKNAKESEGILDFLFIRSRMAEKQTCFHPGAALFLHMCCCAPECSVQPSSWKCLRWPLGAGAQSTPGKEMEGRGLNVTQTGNKLCVPSCSVVHTKGLFQTLALCNLFCQLIRYAMFCQELTQQTLLKDINLLNSPLSFWYLLTSLIYQIVINALTSVWWQSGLNGRFGQKAIGHTGNASSGWRSNGKTSPFTPCSQLCLVIYGELSCLEEKRHVLFPGWEKRKSFEPKTSKYWTWSSKNVSTTSSAGERKCQPT